MERDRSQDDWRDEDRDKPRAEIKLYTTDVPEPGGGAPYMDPLMAAVVPLGWRRISWQHVEPGKDDEVADGAEGFAKALDELIAEAQNIRRELADTVEFEDGDDAPSLFRLDTLKDEVDDAWERYVTWLDHRADAESERIRREPK